VLLCCAGVLLGACSDRLPHLTPLPADAVILAFGDSLTAGSGAEPEQSYPAALARLTGRKVINAGVPGEISARARARLPALLERYHPGLLILCHGGNDLLRRLDLQALRSNLEAMIRAARDRDIPVMLIGVPRPGLFGPRSAGLYKELAARHALLFEGDSVAAVEADQRLKSDRVHPNAAGYRLIAQSLYRVLQDSGALD